MKTDDHDPFYSATWLVIMVGAPVLGALFLSAIDGPMAGLTLLAVVWMCLWVTLRATTWKGWWRDA